MSAFIKGQSKHHKQHKVINYPFYKLSPLLFCPPLQVARQDRGRIRPFARRFRARWSQNCKCHLSSCHLARSQVWRWDVKQNLQGLMSMASLKLHWITWKIEEMQNTHWITWKIDKKCKNARFPLNNMGNLSEVKNMWNPY